MYYKLPIYEKKKEILDALQQNEQCLVLSGQTGCGKSTQLPIIIHKENSTSKILCTQPRRVACTNIARRVAQELEYQIGDQIGFHIGKQPQYNKDTKIIFITTGILMNYLIYEPEKLSNVDYLILDEVHERSIELDFIFLILKGTLHMHKHLKVVLMSATLGKNQLQIFFGQKNCEKVKIQKRLKFSQEQNIGENQNQDDPQNKCSHVVIEQKMKFKVFTYFIDTLNEFKNFQSEYIQLYSKKLLNYKKALLVKEFLSLSLDLIKHILHLEKINTFQPYGIFLIFLPGFTEIIYYKKLLIQMLQQIDYQNIEIVQMHSKLLQNQDISQFSNNKTYFIIATNIAESSITIPNVRYIIDFCLVKQQVFYDRRSMLELGWSSKSSIKQRKGRTGRCNDGYFFAMINSEFYKNLYDFQQPDIIRVPLDKLILQINTIRKNLSKNKKQNIQQEQSQNRIQKKLDMQLIYEIFRNPYNFFSLAIEQITLQRIEDSIKYLLQNNAIIATDKKNVYNNTFFGCIYQTLPCTLQLAKLIMFGKYLGCLEETIICVSIIDSHKNIFLSTKNMDEQQIEHFYKMQNYYSKGYNCDYIIRIELFKAWCKQFQITDWQKQKISEKKKALIRQGKSDFNQQWLQQNFTLQDGMISIFEYYYLIKKNLQNTNKGFLQKKTKIDYKLTKYERLKCCLLLTFFPTIAEVSVQDSYQYEKDQYYLQNYLKFNAKYTIKIENPKFSQFLNEKNKYLKMEQIDQARSIYIKKLTKILQKKYGNFIKSCEFLGENCMVQFKASQAINKIKEILFIEKLQRKEQHSLKLFSFVTGAQIEDFELQDNPLGKKNKPYLEIGEFNSDKFKTIQKEQIEFALKMIKITYFDHLETCDALTKGQLYIQSQSFNHTLIFPEIDEQQQDIFLISDSYTSDSKDKKCFRNTCLFSKFDNIFETLLILYSRKKEYKYDKNKILKTINYFHQDYNLKKWYQEQDVTQIEKLNKKIVYAFQNFSFDFLKSFETDLVEILQKKRYSYIFDEQWYDDFLYYNKSKYQNNKIKNNDKTELIEKYFKYKNDIIKQQQFIQELSQLGSPQLVCNICQNYICLIKEIDQEKNDYYRSLKTKELRENQKISKNMISQYDLKNYENQIQLIENFKYVYLCPLDHLIAFEDDQKIFIPDFINYSIKYCDATTQDFDKFNFDLEAILKQHQLCLNQKRKYLQEFECKICYEKQQFQSFYEAYKHFESNDHKEEQKYFKKYLSQLKQNTYLYIKIHLNFVIFFCFFLKFLNKLQLNVLTLNIRN